MGCEKSKNTMTELLYDTIMEILHDIFLVYTNIELFKWNSINLSLLHVVRLLLLFIRFVEVSVFIQLIRYGL